jgi:hypothetical protein
MSPVLQNNPLAGAQTNSHKKSQSVGKKVTLNSTQILETAVGHAAPNLNNSTQLMQLPNTKYFSNGAV